jgi:hypothetical protein
VQEIATKLDKMYRLSEEECQRLRAQFKCQEDDREYLIRQVGEGAGAGEKGRPRLHGWWGMFVYSLLISGMTHAVIGCAAKQAPAWHPSGSLSAVVSWFTGCRNWYGN